MDKALLAGSTALLLMKLLEDGDMYGYQMITELRNRSNKTFDLKAGTLYPLLHSLEQKGFITSWEEQNELSRPRRFYHLTDAGRKQLIEKEAEWKQYVEGVTSVLRGGACLA